MSVHFVFFLHHVVLGIDLLKQDLLMTLVSVSNDLLTRLVMLAVIFGVAFPELGLFLVQLALVLVLLVLLLDLLV